MQMQFAGHEMNAGELGLYKWTARRRSGRAGSVGDAVALALDELVPWKQTTQNRSHSRLQFLSGVWGRITSLSGFLIMEESVLLKFACFFL